MLCNGIKISKAITLAAVALFVSACATSPKVSVVQANDSNLTKEQLLAEIQKLDDTTQKIDSKKGFTGTNVASALFFLPGLVYTHMDANAATSLVDQRRNHLMALYNQKSQEGHKDKKHRS